MNSWSLLKIVLLLHSSLFVNEILAQKKSLQATRLMESITIDGKSNESAWYNAAIATDFVMFQPDNGKAATTEKRTEVKVVYDDQAVYINAKLFDSEPDKVLKEITKRDDFAIADVFGVFINGYNDGQQNFQFFVSAADGQADCVATDTNGEDYSWDAIWNSKAVLTSFGWEVEMRIPYAAIRFPKTPIQTWGINFFREIRRDRQKYSWNFIDAKLGTFTQQNGVLQGIENIDTPLRLFLFPYASYYVNANAQQKTYGTFKGGLDIKYGINDAFTLDAILIPDFGQTRFDDTILNLGPFEQQFNENRPFFTEGTELFSKGNLLYTRRIGGVPTRSPKREENEIITKMPGVVNLLNAFKVSGRNKRGLGVGILNAITEKTSVRLYDTISKASRDVVVEPLANYNVIVVDQRFRKNSSVSFVNTNVIRSGDFRDANVSALVWDLNTKANTYNLSGDFKYSQVHNEQQKNGYSTQLNFAETSGKYRYSFGADLMSKDYNINDLGINFQTNYYSIYGNANYRILNPTKRFNGFRVNYNNYFQFNKTSGQMQEGSVDLNTNIDTKNNNSYGFGFNANPFERFDYYEPQFEGRHVILPTSYGFWAYYSRNYNYKFAFDINPEYFKSDEPGREFIAINLSPRYRFSDHLALVYNFSYSRRNNNKGYIDKIFDPTNSNAAPEIIFANRNVVTYAHNLSAKYSVNSLLNFNLDVRQYWSYAENLDILLLANNGRLQPYTNYTKNRNSNFYSWNLDLNCSWWFSPGSQVSILYRNSSANFEREIVKDYNHTLRNLLSNNKLQHTLSISVRYFIDYNQAKQMFKKS